MNEHRKLYLVFIVLAALHFGAGHAHGEYRIEPSITLGEQYNDNIFLAPRDARTDYITRVVPSIHFFYTAPVWEWDVMYSYDYRYYAKGSRDDDTTHFFKLLNHNTLKPDYLFLDLKDDYRRVSLDTTHDFTRESYFFNQTDVNEVSLSPYIKFNLTSHTTATTGYQLRNIWYRDRTGVNKTEHTLFGDIVDELSPRTVLVGGLKYTFEDAATLTYHRVDLYAGPRYEYADGSTIWVLLGDSFIFSHDGNSGSQATWDVGINHKFVSYTLGFNAALTYIDDPARIQRREDRYVANFRKETDRLTLAATAGHWEYRDVLTKHLQETRNGIGGTIGYGITSALKASYSLSIDRYEDNVFETFSMLYLNTVRLEYLFPANTFVGFDYRFAHGYSPDAANFFLNYDNNILGIEIRKVF